MTEEPKTEEPKTEESAPAEKLLIDSSSDFQFHAAYLSYSNAYDHATDPDIKKQLNQQIKALKQNQIDYQTFYRSIGQFRRDPNAQQHHGRAFIKTQRKRDWRRSAQKRERNKRHRK
jgi:hypothetical protein